MDLEYIAQSALAIVEETGRGVKKERLRWERAEFNHKEDNSLVTAIDIATEEKLIKGFRQLLPEAGYIAEEKYKEGTGEELAWIIDPIDGTTNFVHNVPMYCISVALKDGDKVVLGIIYEISSGECFWSHDGVEGAFLNNKPITVSKTEGVKNSLLATGFPVTAFNHIDKYMEELKRFMIEARGVRRLGSAAMDLAYVACGRYEGFFEYNLSPWDVAAGAYLVQKAGGRVTDFSGGDNYIFGGQMLASNKHIHEEFLTYFKQK